MIEKCGFDSMDVSNDVAFKGLFLLQTVYSNNIVEYTFEMKLASLYLLSCEYMYKI